MNPIDPTSNTDRNTDDLDRFAARLRAAILAGDGQRVSDDLNSLLATVRQLRRENAELDMAYRESCAALQATIERLQKQVDDLSWKNADLLRRALGGGEE